MGRKQLDYKWYLKDLKNVEKNGLKVFSTFACGGGSTMGYKLAGFDVIGANDIDPKMAEVYKKNHNPKIYLECPIGDLINQELPEELYNLDILDGSPPCSTFSMAGSRDNAFKKEKVFREGQAKQVLSDLFFDWIKLVDKLQPKVAIAENVKGMLAGNAKAYTKKILQELDKIGYEVQLFLVNAKDVGLPQARERVFFICKRKDLKLPKMKLAFNDKEVGVKTAFDRIKDINYKGSDQTKSINFKYWEMCKPGESFKKYHPKGSLFSLYKMPLDKPSCTITATSNNFYHWESMRNLSKYELCMLGSYPIDYDFLDNEPGYLIGMSVPPILAGRIAQEVAKQIFKK